MSGSPPPLSGDEPEDAFVAKWRARWPEWSVAEVFVPRPDRSVALAWAALQQELTDAAWGGSDPRPGEAKLMWWQEELLGWGLGRRRHPLGITLQRMPAPWADVAAALPALRASRERPRDGTDAFSQLLPLATAAAGVEHALFGGIQSDTDAARLVSATWLQTRLANDAAAALPLTALARVGGTDAGHLDPDAGWRAELLRDWPTASRATRPRKLWAALARARLARGAAAEPMGAWPALWVAWGAARN